MPDIKGLLADPEFNKLDPTSQKAVLGRIDSAFANLSDGDFQSFRQQMVESEPIRGTEKLGGKAPEVPKRVMPELQGPAPGAENSVGGGGNEPGLPAIVVQGMHQLGRAIPAFSNSWKRGASDVIEGGMKTAAPLAIPATVAAPLVAAGGLALGTAGDFAGRTAARGMGASPDTERLVGNLAGLAAGAGGTKATSALGRGAAKGFANVAEGVGFRNKLHEADPGYGYLTDTSGIKPSTVADSRRQRLSELSAVKDAELANTGPISLKPARQVVDEAHNLYGVKRGSVPIATALEPVRSHLQGNAVTGVSYPETVPASEAIEIARGLKPLSRWNATSPTEAAGTAQKAYGATIGQIHEANPRIMALDERSQNLMAGMEPNKVTGLRAGPMENAAHRMTAHTGAAAIPLMGAATHGPIGGLAALAAQTAMGMPEVSGLIARGLWRGVGGERFGVPAMPSEFIPRGLLDAGSLKMPAGAESPVEGRTGYPAGEWERQGQKRLPPASGAIPMPPRVATALPSASSVSGISGMAVPEFVSRTVLDPRMIEAPVIERGLQPGSPDPFRNPQTIPVDIPESSPFHLSRQPGQIAMPKAGTPTEAGVSPEWLNSFIKSGAPAKAKKTK